jgi:hypothetical protein
MIDVLPYRKWAGHVVWETTTESALDQGRSGNSGGLARAGRDHAAWLAGLDRTEASPICQPFAAVAELEIGVVVG